MLKQTNREVQHNAQARNQHSVIYISEGSTLKLSLDRVVEHPPPKVNHLAKVGDEERFSEEGISDFERRATDANTPFWGFGLRHVSDKCRITAPPESRPSSRTPTPSATAFLRLFLSNSEKG